MKNPGLVVLGIAYQTCGVNIEICLHLVYTLFMRNKKIMTRQPIKRIGKTRIGISILLLFITCLCLFGQTENIRFKHITIKDGLSQGAINCMLQDRRCFMWFGTQDGLNRYDGYEFKVYKHDPKDHMTISDKIMLVY